MWVVACISCKPTKKAQLNQHKAAGEIPAALLLIERTLQLEAEVAERLVRFCHAVNFVTLFHGAAAAFGGLHQLIGQTE